MSRPSFFAELKRRNVLRVGAFYAGAAWLLVQVATQVFPFFDVPNSVVRVIVLLCLVGAPLALVFAWFWEWTPQGLKRESELLDDATIPRGNSQRLVLELHNVLQPCQPAYAPVVKLEWFQSRGCRLAAHQPLLRRVGTAGQGS